MACLARQSHLCTPEQTPDTHRGYRLKSRTNIFHMAFMCDRSWCWKEIPAPLVPEGFCGFSCIPLVPSPLGGLECSRTEQLGCSKEVPAQGDGLEINEVFVQILKESTLKGSKCKTVRIYPESAAEGNLFYDPEVLSGSNQQPEMGILSESSLGINWMRSARQEYLKCKTTP